MPCSDKYDEQMNFCIKKRNLYLRTSIIWQTVYYLVTLVSLLTSIIVIYLCTFKEAEELRIFIYSVISLFATVVDFVMKPKDVAVGHRKSFNLLDREIATQQNKNTTLTETVYKCEEIIESVFK